MSGFNFNPHKVIGRGMDEGRTLAICYNPKTPDAQLAAEKKRQAWERREFGKTITDQMWRRYDDDDKAMAASRVFLEMFDLMPYARGKRAKLKRKAA